MYSLNKDFKNNNFETGAFTVTNFLTDNEIKVLKIYVNNNSNLIEKGTISSESDKDPQYLAPNLFFYNNGEPKKKKDYRNSSIIWLNPKDTPIMKEIFKKIFSKIVNVNNEVFGFNLTDVSDLQYTIYQKGEYYNAHVDIDRETLGGNIIRKLSFSIQLTDETEYDGGDLIFYQDNEEGTKAKRDKGSITFFPSFVLHKVSEVTRGTRCSLVGWVYGPKFV